MLDTVISCTVSSWHGYCKFTGHSIIVDTDHCYYMITERLHGLVLHIYVPLVHGYTNARTTAFHIIVIILHIYVMLTYHCYTCMYGFSVLVIWIPVHITCIIVPCYPRIPVICLFPVTDIVIPVTGYMSCWYAICGIPHLLFPFPIILFPFPVILFYAINRAQVQLSG